jgi:hypothetical protein
MARRVTRASRGIRLPRVQIPVEPPPSVRDRVVGMYEGPFGWPEDVQRDPGLIQMPLGGATTMDVPQLEEIRPDRSQEIAVRRRRGRRRPREEDAI